jgi:hypothetical protein
MDMNEYCLSELARERLQEMRAEARAMALRAQARPRPPLRVTVGHALVRLGNRLLSGFTPVRATA